MSQKHVRTSWPQKQKISRASEQERQKGRKWGRGAQRGLRERQRVGLRGSFLVSSLTVCVLCVYRFITTLHCDSGQRIKPWKSPNVVNTNQGHLSKQHQGQQQEHQQQNIMFLYWGWTPLKYHTYHFLPTFFHLHLSLPLSLSRYLFFSILLCLS